MKLELFAIKDELVGFAPPMAFPTTQEAERFFRLRRNSNEFIAGAPEDYSIWKIGEMETDTGVIHTTEPELLMRASNIVERKES